MSMMSTVADSTVRTHFREPDPSKPKLVLAYSGGLDTSCQLSWLVKQKGFEVCAYIADLGQEETDSKEKLEEISKKAEESGAYAFYCEDARHEFVTDFVLPCIQSNAVYEGRYLLGTSIARPCISKRQIDVCRAEDAMFVSRLNGQGNDRCALNWPTMLLLQRLSV